MNKLIYVKKKDRHLFDAAVKSLNADSVSDAVAIALRLAIAKGEPKARKQYLGFGNWSIMCPKCGHETIFDEDEDE